MAAALAEWPGTRAELAEFLAAVRRTCETCNRRLNFRTPCPEHLAGAALAAYDSGWLRLVVGMRRAPTWFWFGGGNSGNVEGEWERQEGEHGEGPGS